jgi:chlorite dismutase
MAIRSEARVQSATSSLFPVPLTLEGASVLHQILRFRWAEWRAFQDRDRVVAEAAPLLQRLEAAQSALYSVLGHKGDLLLVHFRNSFDELKEIELQLAGLELSNFLEPARSYLSVVELGLYESSVKLYQSLRARGVLPQ